MPDPEKIPQKEFSRRYSRRIDPAAATNEDYIIGALLRIADATEAMATNYGQMQRDLERSKAEASRLQTQLDAAKGSIRALKGVITKSKRQPN